MSKLIANAVDALLSSLKEQTPEGSKFDPNLAAVERQQLEGVVRQLLGSHEKDVCEIAESFEKRISPKAAEDWHRQARACNYLLWEEG